MHGCKPTAISTVLGCGMVGPSETVSNCLLRALKLVSLLAGHHAALADSDICAVASHLGSCAAMQSYVTNRLV